MTTTTRSAECNAGGTPLMLAFDLGSTKWTLGFTTAPAQRPRIRTMPAGDLGTLVKEIQLAKARFGLPLGAAVRSCDEAGRDGFWLHRWLLAHAVENVVVEASSIEVNRRARRAKTDRLDTSQLLALLLRWHGGERHVWSVVRVPAPEAEAHRQVTREIATGREDRQRVRNRIQGLLATQGIRPAPCQGDHGGGGRPEVQERAAC
jgi:transposase